MNGWFPRINRNGDIVSGDGEIWITPAAGAPRQVGTGIGPIWAGLTPVWNRGNGTTQIGEGVEGFVIPIAYNDYVGSDVDGQWAGFDAPHGRIDVYNGATKVRSIENACGPRFGDGHFAYLTPYQTGADFQRQLVVDDAVVAHGEIMDCKIGGGEIIWQDATGTYTRVLLDAAGAELELRNDEAPIVVFAGPDGPWMLSGTNLPGGVLFVRPVHGATADHGYALVGVRMSADARMRNGRLRVVSSSERGDAQFDDWIDFTTPRADLRTVLGVEPPKPPVVITPIKTPIVDHPAPPKQEQPHVTPTPFNPADVQFIDSPADLASWPETARITRVNFDEGFIAVDHTGRDSWADLPFGDGSDGHVQYTLGMCCFIDGRWRGATIVQFWKGRELNAGGGEDNVAKDWFYSDRWGALLNHQPARGELVALFAAAGNDRDNDNVPTGANRQRTDFVVIPWGTDYVAAPEHQNPPPLDPNPPAQPSAPEDHVTDAQVQKIVDAINANGAATVAKLEEVKQAFIKFGADAKTYLPEILAVLGSGGGASALGALGGLLGKKKG